MQSTRLFQAMQVRCDRSAFAVYILCASSCPPFLYCILGLLGLRIASFSRGYASPTEVPKTAVACTRTVLRCVSLSWVGCCTCDSPCGYLVCAITPSIADLNSYHSAICHRIAARIVMQIASWQLEYHTAQRGTCRIVIAFLFFSLPLSVLIRNVY